MINWPETLVKELARRRCALFLGAGVSASALDAQGSRPLQWGEFLRDACHLIRGSPARKNIEKLIAERRFLLALQAITQEADRADYHSFLDKHFNNAAFSPGELHRLILRLDSRIVVTTNFDKIYERLCLSTSQDGYKVIPYYSDSLADELRSDTRLIIKAHGTIDDVKKMVFTKSEYHRAKRQHSQFYTLLRAIFLTQTCVFIGCSLDDPDVLLVLEDVQVTASNQRPHYALVLSGAQNPYALRDWQEAYNIRALEYGPNHDSLISDMRNLVEAVESIWAAQQPI